jgi:hypothetical protein
VAPQQAPARLRSVHGSFFVLTHPARRKSIDFSQFRKMHEKPRPAYVVCMKKTERGSSTRPSELRLLATSKPFPQVCLSAPKLSISLPASP